MDDGCLPLYSEADIKLAFEANESFRREIGITFVDWVNIYGRSMINSPTNSPNTPPPAPPDKDAKTRSDVCD
jgi:hypothetical protein